MKVHPAARREIAAAEAWYAERSGLASKRFRLAIADLLETVAASPLSFGPAHDDPTMRQAWAHRFPYRVVFDVRSNGEVFVLSVHHAAREPGFWRRRQPR